MPATRQQMTMEKSPVDRQSPTPQLSIYDEVQLKQWPGDHRPRPARRRTLTKSVQTLTARRTSKATASLPRLENRRNLGQLVWWIRPHFHEHSPRKLALALAPLAFAADLGGNFLALRLKPLPPFVCRYDRLLLPADAPAEDAADTGIVGMVISEAHFQLGPHLRAKVWRTGLGSAPPDGGTIG
eukprot:1711548-Amphidinium_carterae.1